MKKRLGILNLTLSKRTDLLKLILAAYILAIGSGLISNFFTDYFKNELIFILLIGLFLLILVVIYFIITIINEAKNKN